MSIPSDLFIKGDQIGKGSYGIIYAVSKGDEPYAMKRNLVGNEGGGICYGRELDMLVKLKGHPFIIDLKDVIHDDGDLPLSPLCLDENGTDFRRDDKIHFLMEKAESNLSSVLGDISPSQIKLYIVQLLLALEWCHNKGIIHQDLKPENILVCADGVKLADFGLSRIHTGYNTEVESVVSAWYRAPEICCLAPYDYKSDIWSLGCVVYEMYNYEPFLKCSTDNCTIFNSILRNLSTEPDSEDVKSLIERGKERIVRSPRTKSINRETYTRRINFSRFATQDIDAIEISLLEDFLSHLLCFDASKRYDASQALNHSFLDEYQPYIREVRKSFPPSLVTLPTVYIKNTVERNIMVNHAVNIFNNREKFDWYTHSTLFHAIDLYDRYLEMMDDVDDNEDVILVRFYTCLYIFHKYFTVLTYMYKWNEFVPSELVVFRRESEEFEQFIVKEVCHYSIYRDTLYEMPPFYRSGIDDQHVVEILGSYAQLENYHGSVRALYRQICGIKS